MLTNSENVGFCLLAAAAVMPIVLDSDQIKNVFLIAAFVYAAYNKLRRPEQHFVSNNIMTAQDEEIAVLQDKIWQLSNGRNNSIPNVQYQKFDADAPEDWFAGFEIAMTGHNITTDQAKLTSLLGKLTSTQLIMLNPIITDQSRTAKYSECKMQLCISFQLSWFERLDKAYKLKWDESVRPSEFLGTLSRTLGSDITDGYGQKLLSYLFIRSMPDSIQMHLQKEVDFPHKELDPKLLGSLADKMIPASSQVCAIQRTSIKNPMKELCWVHAKYKEKARFCAGTPSNPCPMWRSASSSTKPINNGSKGHQRRSQYNNVRMIDQDETSQTGNDDRPQE